MRINNKLVLITGATSGIGLLLAQRLAEAGAFPVLTGRNKEKLEQAVQMIKGSCASYVLDVNSDAQVTETMARIEQKHGLADVLINNAGYGQFEYVVDASMQHFEEMMNTNYLGLVRCTKAVLPGFLERGSGQIVNIASVAGKIGSPKSAGYTATKHAVLGFTNALRLELHGTGIVVSAVNPGPIDTPFFEVADPGGRYVNNVRWLMMPPERVVRAIIQVIEKRKAEVDLPMTAALGAKLYQLMPGIANRMAARLLNQK